MMGDVLAFAEQRDGSLRGVANETVTAATSLARGLGGSVTALAVGGAGLSAGAAVLGEYGADTIRVAEAAELTDYNGDVQAGVVADMIRSGGYAAVVFAATAQGKDLAPRVAALLDVPLASDVTELDAESGSVTAVRPVYAGKAFTRIGFDATPVLVSIRPNVFQPAASAGAGAVEVVSPSFDGAPRSRVLGVESAGSGQLDVSEASVVVAGGRGLKGPESWSLLEALRDALGADAALGASRAVVDAGWRPHGEQVGQTGKTVAPKLYFAIGISGAVQHLAGMRTAGTIVAVNKDPDAPIFQVSDYGIVGDLFEVVPRLTEEIARVRGD
jgi:electron transfer flavoprotein alpha subunit